MEQHDRELTDAELDGALRQWRVPGAPEHLRAAVFGESGAGLWRRFWTASIRVPLPVAAALLALLLIAGGYWAGQMRQARAIDKGFGVFHNSDLMPVSELRPRIIRGNHARN